MVGAGYHKSNADEFTTFTDIVSAGGLPASIPNPGSISRTLNFPVEGTIVDFELYFGFSTPCERNLRATLSDPSGHTEIVMESRPEKSCTGVLTPSNSTNPSFDAGQIKGDWVFTMYDIEGDTYSSTLDEGLCHVNSVDSVV